MGETRELYPKHDAEQLGEWYARHFEAMTAEGLHGKSDIAAQLAWRDKKIAALESGAVRELIEAAKAILKNAPSISGHDINNLECALTRIRDLP